MTEPADKSQRRASAELFAALQREQRAFGRFMAVLVALVLLAAVIAAGGVWTSYQELQRQSEETARLRDEAQALRDETSRLRAAYDLQQAGFKVILSDMQRQRESFSDQFNALRLARDAANRNLDLAFDPRRQSEDPAARRAVVEEAVALARDHFVGDPDLNDSTAELIVWALEAIERDPALLAEPAERLILDAARADWLSYENQTSERLRALGAPEHAQRWRAYAAAGFARLYFRQADALDLMWSEGCSEAVMYADEAMSLGLTVQEAPALSVWRGECLRKHGDTAAAYESFRAAREAMGETLQGVREDGSSTRDDNRWWEQIDLRRLAVHGEGTTLIALVAQEPDGAQADARLGEALTWLRRAAHLRSRRDATDVGIAYTNENIGFVYLLRGSWDAALAHTEEIDRIVPLAWNLTVRHIAASEKLDALEGDADADPAEIARLREIKAETELVLSVMRYAWFDERELKRLLPPQYEATVDQLIAAPKAAYEAAHSDG